MSESRKLMQKGSLLGGGYVPAIYYIRFSLDLEENVFKHGRVHLGVLGHRSFSPAESAK